MPYQPKILGAEMVEDKGIVSISTCNNEKYEGAEQSQQFIYRMGGNSCLSGDYIGFWQFGKALKIGDVIVFNDMIHYTMVKTTTFNGVKHPSIGIFSKEKGFRLVRVFGYEDYRNKLS
jgi:diaminopimelate decarboxylase